MNDRVGQHEAVECVPHALQVAHERLATRIIVAEVAEGLRHLVHPNGIGRAFFLEAIAAPPPRPPVTAAPPVTLGIYAAPLLLFHFWKRPSSSSSTSTHASPFG